MKVGIVDLYPWHVDDMTNHPALDCVPGSTLFPMGRVEVQLKRTVVEHSYSQKLVPSHPQVQASFSHSLTLALNIADMWVHTHSSSRASSQQAMSLEVYSLAGASADAALHRSKVLEPVGSPEMRNYCRPRATLDLGMAARGTVAGSVRPSPGLVDRNREAPG